MLKYESKDPWPIPYSPLAKLGFGASRIHHVSLELGEPSFTSTWNVKLFLMQSVLKSPLLVGKVLGMRN